MSFLNRLSKGVGRAADQAKFEADKLVRVNRLNSEIGDVQAQLRDIKVNIAERVLEAHKAGEPVPSSIADMISRVRQLEDRLAVTRTQLEAVRAEKFEDKFPAMPPTPPAPQSTMETTPHIAQEQALPGTHPQPMDEMSTEPLPAGVPPTPEAAPEEPPVTDVSAYTEYGSQAEEPQTCTECHELLRPGARYCGHCGQPVESKE